MSVSLTREQSREMDRIAIEELGLPGIVLMENAARSLARIITDVFQRIIDAAEPVGIICGGGNNGGDGFALARHLSNLGLDVTAYAMKGPDELRGDASVMHGVADRLGLVAPAWDAPSLQWAIERCCCSGLVVDAILGTGFEASRGLRSPIDAAIRAINEGRGRGVSVLAVDVPSGLDCNTGQPAEEAVQADVTATFMSRKVGFAEPTAEAYVGQIVLADIGVSLRAKVFNSVLSG